MATERRLTNIFIFQKPSEPESPNSKANFQHFVVKERKISSIGGDLEQAPVFKRIDANESLAVPSNERRLQQPTASPTKPRLKWFPIPFKPAPGSLESTTSEPTVTPVALPPKGLLPLVNFQIQIGEDDDTASFCGVQLGQINDTDGTHIDVVIDFQVSKGGSEVQRFTQIMLLVGFRKPGASDRLIPQTVPVRRGHGIASEVGIVNTSTTTSFTAAATASQQPGLSLDVTRERNRALEVQRHLDDITSFQMRNGPQRGISRWCVKAGAMTEMLHGGILEETHRLRHSFTSSLPQPVLVEARLVCQYDKQGWRKLWGDGSVAAPEGKDKYALYELTLLGDGSLI